MNHETSIFAEAHRLEERGEAFALVFIIESRGSVPRNSGHMIIRMDGSTLGTVGGGPMEAQVVSEARQALIEGRSRTVRRRLTPDGPDAAGMECGGAMAVRIDVTAAPPRLLLVGGGHVNLAVAQAASVLGFAVEVAESRDGFCTPERFPMARSLYHREDLMDAIDDAAVDENTWILIATHNDDIRSLGRLAESGAAYIGMLGSKRKVAVAMAALKDSGVPNTVIASLRAPVGMDIGAQTPEEIAISVMAEILKIRSGRTGLPLQSMSKDLVVIRGGGDLATGTAWRLKRSGFRVVVLEVPNPTVIRRRVAFGEALLQGKVVVEGIEARRAADVTEVYAILEDGGVPVLADPEALSLSALKPTVVVDAIMAKKNLGTTQDMAPTVVALGPGFTAGTKGDCHAVIETARGHELGRVILEGSAAPNTGKPGIIAGKGAERVIRSPIDGVFQEAASIGDLVTVGDVIGRVETPDDPVEISAPITGKIRGLLNSGVKVTSGFKVGDIDPRGAEVNENLISDKARAIAGAVLEAILFHRTQRTKK